MKDGVVDKHESYGMIQINKFTGNSSQFFGSDLIHNGGVSLTITEGDKERSLNSEWYHSGRELIRIELSSNQFVDAITSGMNTNGVPCTIKRFNGKVEQIEHVVDKKEVFSSDMKETQDEYKERIEGILSMLEGNIGKRKANEIKHELEVLRSHIGSNTNFVLTCFNEAMEKSVTEAKHSIANYIDGKVHSLGIEAMREDLQMKIDND